MGSGRECGQQRESVGRETSHLADEAATGTTPKPDDRNEPLRDLRLGEE